MKGHGSSVRPWLSRRSSVQPWNQTRDCSQALGRGGSGRPQGPCRARSSPLWLGVDPGCRWFCAQYRVCERLPQRRLPVPVERPIRRPDSVPWKLAKDSGGIQELSSQLNRTGKAWASSGSESEAIAGRVPAELCRPGSARGRSCRVSAVPKACPNEAARSVFRWLVLARTGVSSGIPIA